MKNKPIILVPGEPKSVFFEIFFKAIKKYDCKSPLILICSKKKLLLEKEKYRCKKNLRVLNSYNIKDYLLSNKSINVIDIVLQNSVHKRFNNEFIKRYLKQSFEVAFKIIKSGFTDKFINGPMDKNKFLNKKFLGMTEYISNEFKVKKTGMLIYNKKLSVCPLTTHLPIKLVTKKITKKSIKDKIEVINCFYLKNFKFKPRIAVTGLNPHCESIHLFNEDKKILYSSIQQAVKKGVNVKGPFPADTIFLSQNRKKFDIILGMYHDQVLSPFKVLFEFDAINITMGLPFIRVSPDHGPNKIMIGKNKSNPLSLINALKFLDK